MHASSSAIYAMYKQISGERHVCSEGLLDILDTKKKKKKQIDFVSINGILLLLF